ncbi:hypothetical protein HY003_03290 [Candidatus Saccharibacteria bacterium]|nr:hypothetical protein [Candidatus Saccharibacteria bacterium]
MLWLAPDVANKRSLYWPCRKIARSQAKLDLPKIVRSQSELSRAKTVLSEGEVAIATLREEKPFVADRIRSGDGGVLGKSS